MNNGDAGRVIAGQGTREMPGRYPCLGGRGPARYIVFGTLSLMDGRQDRECFYTVLQQTQP